MAVRAKKPAQMQFENRDLPAAPARLVELAINKGASVEVLEKLLTLQERFDANEAKKAFAQAISDVRADLPKIVKDQLVHFTTSRGTTHYKYENLANVIEALAPVVSEYGLSFRWRTRSDERNVYVTCILSHEQGHSEESDLACRHDDTGNKNPIQAIGSAVKYLMRYTLEAAIGVAAAAEDDDGRGEVKIDDQSTPDTLVKDSRETLNTVRPKDEKRYTNAQLGAAIMSYCNDHSDQAKEILMALTGRTTLAGMKPDEATAAYKKFEQDYLSRQPGDDLPETWPDTPKGDTP